MAQISATVKDQKMIDTIRKISDHEKRSFSSMVEILLEEALHHRRKTLTKKETLHPLITKSART